MRRRTRPILLTMATTVAGLTPLALSDTTLWPPLAWAMISGLIASTLLTLLVIPALYKLLFTERQRPSFGGLLRRRVAAPASVAMVCVGLLVAPSLRALEETDADTTRPGGVLALTLDEVVERSVGQPQGSGRGSSGGGC